MMTEKGKHYSLYLDNMAQNKVDSIIDMTHASTKKDVVYQSINYYYLVLKIFDVRIDSEDCKKYLSEKTISLLHSCDIYKLNQMLPFTSFSPEGIIKTAMMVEQRKNGHTVEKSVKEIHALYKRFGFIVYG